MYRVMPEYILYYELSHPEPWLEAAHIIPMASLPPYQNFSGVIHPSSSQLQPVRKLIKKKKQKGRRLG